MISAASGYVSVVIGRERALDDFLGDYLVLTLRLDRLMPGLADIGNLDPDLRQRVAAAPAPKPADLVRQSGRLVDELADLQLDPVRHAFLSGQLHAVECTARRLTGQSVPFCGKFWTCFDVVPRLGRVDEYAAVHAELDALLPGPGPLAPRLAGYRRAQEVPRQRLGAAVAALCELLRGPDRCVGAVAAGGDRVVPDRARTRRGARCTGTAGGSAPRSR